MDLFEVGEFEDGSESPQKQDQQDEYKELVENLRKEAQSKTKPRKVFIFWDFESLPLQGKPLGFLLNNLVELVKHYGVVEEFHVFTATPIDRLSSSFLSRVGIKITTKQYFGTSIITEFIRICVNEKQPFVLFMATNERDYMRSLSRITLTGNHTILISDLRENHHFRLTKATSEVVDWNDFLPLPEADTENGEAKQSTLEDPYSRPQTLTQELLSMRSWWDDEDEKPTKRKNARGKQNNNTNKDSTQPNSKKQKTDQPSKPSPATSKEEVIPLGSKKSKKAKKQEEQTSDPKVAPDKKVLYQGLWKDIVESLQHSRQAPRLSAIRQNLTKAVNGVPSHAFQLYGIKPKSQAKDTANMIWKDFESFLKTECGIDNSHAEHLYWPSSGKYDCSDLDSTAK